MNQQEIQIFKLKLRADLVKGFLGAFIRAVRGPDFAGDEEFRPGDAGLADRLAHQDGVVVDLRRIEMAIAELDCRLNRALEVFIERNLPCTEADCRHFNAVGELCELRKRLIHGDSGTFGHHASTIGRLRSGAVEIFIRSILVEKWFRKFDLDRSFMGRRTIKPVWRQCFR